MCFFVLSISHSSLWSENNRRIQEVLAEAGLEAGHNSFETMDFADETLSQHSDDSTAGDSEPVGGPLLSEFFKTCSQERRVHFL